MEQISFKEYDPELPIDKIDVSENNVRKSQRAVGIEELKGSIERIGLVHPVIVMRKGDRYELIVGQRRLIAFKELDRKTIPALIIAPIDEVSRTIVSFGENIHRRKLPYGDTIKVCNRLYKEYAGTTTQRINQVGKDLGLSRQTVIRYLTYQLVPDRVRDMVEDGVLDAAVAERVTAAFWPNEAKIFAIAREVGNLTSAEMNRVLDIGKAKPKESIESIVEEAKKPPTVVQITITLPTSLANLLQKEARKRNMDVHELIRTSIETYLMEGGA
jgi:ParB family chromosome partitioning protein